MIRFLVLALVAAGALALVTTLDGEGLRRILGEEAGALGIDAHELGALAKVAAEPLRRKSRLRQSAGA